MTQGDPQSQQVRQILSVLYLLPRPPGERKAKRRDGFRTQTSGLLSGRLRREAGEVGGECYKGKEERPSLFLSKKASLGMFAEAKGTQTGKSRVLGCGSWA